MVTVDAQAPLPPGTARPPSSLPTRPRCGYKEGLDAITFGTILDRRFSALVSPETEGIPGSFLAVEIKEAQATAAQTFVSGSGRALTVSARGGVNDGVVAIVNDATLTPKFGATLLVHSLGRARRSLQYTTASCDSLEAAVRKAESTHALRVAEIFAHGTAVQRRVDFAALDTKAANIKTELGRLPSPLILASDTLRRDSLLLEDARVTARRSSLQAITPLDEEDELFDVENERNAAYQRAAKLVEPQGFSFRWWSFGFALDNVSYNLFDPAAALDTQISKGTHLTRTLILSYSWISQSAFDYESRYVNVAVRAGWENNLADLTKLEITDRKQYGAPPTERVTEKKTTAYQGNFRNDVETLRLTADYYRFFVENDRVAFHVFPAFLAKNGQTGEVALGAGLLLSSRDAVKKVSNANAELFFNVPDLGNVRNSDKGPWKRGVLGLRLTFPINFAHGS
jgi:hypothetical protein